MCCLSLLLWWSKVENRGSVLVVISIRDYGDGAVVTGGSKIDGGDKMMIFYYLFIVLHEYPRKQRCIHGDG